MVRARGAVIYNPASGRGRGARRRETARALLGDAFDWIATEQPGHATELACAAANDHDIVVACGGDGTVGDVVRGIWQAASHQATRQQTDAPMLGILPLGTGNDVARNLNIPLDVESACRVLLAGKLRRVDLGMANGVPFINNAGAGFDAQVMSAMNSSIRFLTGRPAFLLAILKTLPTFQPFSLTVSSDGDQPRTLEAMMIAVLNGPVFAAGLRAAPLARVDDGLLDVMIVRAISKWRLLPLVLRVFCGRHAGHSAIEIRQARTLTIDTTPAQPVNIDGDVRGQTPLNIQLLPQALRVLV
jgi:diacylglycerol kinase (ATP)